MSERRKVSGPKGQPHPDSMLSPPRLSWCWTSACSRARKLLRACWTCRDLVFKKKKLCLLMFSSAGVSVSWWRFLGGNFTQRRFASTPVPKLTGEGKGCWTTGIVQNYFTHLWILLRCWKSGRRRKPATCSTHDTRQAQFSFSVFICPSLLQWSLPAEGCQHS